jgi:hypothetical protein
MADFYEQFKMELDKANIKADMPAARVVGECLRAAKRAQMALERPALREWCGIKDGPDDRLSGIPVASPEVFDWLACDEAGCNSPQDHAGHLDGPREA